ncbi:hypothetical protein M758_8G005300 [Ceratodon purpureus]|uniref:non-specific serine/threonine protein kinase n=1 Tax=Ceratodon purpureus TaxID=3225 RepID=A0A8T0GZC2_CERPU|nr:hypothetical protein KC19_8G005900 [Ceratodon purpureus]KAG0607151.1 hypothetical protein M758_8G005300 [Ceratodon purpureus]
MDSGGDRVRAPQRQSREEDQYRSLDISAEQHQQYQQMQKQQQQPQHDKQQGTGLMVEAPLQKSLSNMSVKSLPNSPEGGRLRTVANKYAVEGMVGSGAFCKVYQGSDLTNHEVVGIKLEDTRTEHAQLMHESRLYNILRGGKGVPNMRWFGKEQDYNVMVLDLLGPNLLHLFKVCGQRFSLKTVIMLGYQMIDRVEYVHSRGLVHRDLKPDNFLMGCGRQGNQVFIIDFGLAKEYIDPVTRRHIPFRDRKSFTGTARYASRNQHRGIEHSRRDDIESLGYILMYFLRGNLPWQGQNGQRFTDQKQHEYMHNKIKMDTSIEDLCDGYPSQFADFLHHARGLGFYEQPDYSYLRSLFRDLFIQKKFQLDHVYDWTVYTQPPQNTPQQHQHQQQRGSSQAVNSPPVHLQNRASNTVSYCPPLSKPEYRREVVAAN